MALSADDLATIKANLLILRGTQDQPGRQDRHAGRSAR